VRGFFQDAESFTLLLLAAHILLVTVAAVLVSMNRRPSSAIAWVLAIVFIPILGAVAYFFVGYSKLPKARREKQREVNALVLARTEGSPLVSRGLDWPDWLHSAVVLNSNLGALPMVANNSATLLGDYNGAFDAMIADIDSATSYVHVEFYILVLDATTEPYFQALARARRRGVDVRVLSDHLAGLKFPGRKETLEFLQEIGAEYRPMLPVRPWRGEWQRPDLRNHRKICVVDDVLGPRESHAVPERHRRELRHEGQPEARAPVARVDDAR